MSKLRIGYVKPPELRDEAIRAAILQSVRVGTPRAESQAVRAPGPVHSSLIRVNATNGRLVS